VDESEEDEMCDVWGMVDFGHGTAEVRCTQIGPHDQHKCEVILSGNPQRVEHRNVFESGD
jgi:hypothetical protein